MPIYILKHPRMDVTRFIGGVDFFKGTGSTSNLRDASILSNACGCKIYDDKGNELKIVEEEQFETRPDGTRRMSGLKLYRTVPVIGEETKKNEGAADAAPPLYPTEPPKFKRGGRKK